MNDPSSVRGSSSRSVKNPAADELDELRTLLVGPEQVEIEQIRKRLDNPPSSEQVAQVLPEAINLRSEKDESITRAILPSVETAILVSVKKRPKVLADALFPVMGPAIRKAISAAIAGMVQSLNETLEHSLSLRGIKWRLEAFRTGKSFAEVVLLHSLRYRVEQLFLIHKPDGLLLQHISTSSSQTQDADMISGMLTAIQDFVRDSFAVPKEETLNSMQVGELTVWVEEGPFAILAAVIRGKAPEQLRMLMGNALENIHLEKGRELENYNGDSAVFESIRYHLESCLVSQYEAKRRGLSWPLILIVATLLAGMGVWSFFFIRQSRRWDHYVGLLHRQSGLVVVESGRTEGKYFVSGLRDPLAIDPEVLLGQAGLGPHKVISKWEPFQALSPQLIIARAKSILKPPSTVTLTFRDGILSGAGEALNSWITDAEKIAPTIFGVSRWDGQQIKNVDLERLNHQKATLEREIVLFQKGRAELVAGQDALLRETIGKLIQLNATAQKVGLALRLFIVGHADSEGEEAINIPLSRSRAEFVKQTLVFRGFPSTNLLFEGVGSSRPVRHESSEEQRALNRSVSFEIDFIAPKENGVP